MSDLNWIERQVAKAAYRRVEAKVNGLKRWAPVVGVAVLGGGVLLRLFGQNELAQTLEGLGGAVGVTEQSPVGATELAAAVAAVTGVVLKVVAVVKKARGKA